MRQIVEAAGIEFPVAVDTDGRLSGALGFRVVPSAVFCEADGAVAYRHAADCDIADPRVRWNLARFLDGRPLREPQADDPPLSPEALALFAQGRWEDALALDPGNFLIRSQIWVARHPERFYPTVDRAWQERQLELEGYEGPLP